MKNGVDVTIVLPFHITDDLGLRWLRQSIQSVLMQRGVNFEFIIASDGSPMEPPQGWLTDPRIKYVKMKHTNKAITAVEATLLGSGKYRCNIAHDDYLLHNNDLANRHMLAEKNKDAALIWTNGYKVDIHGKILREFKHPCKIDGRAYAAKGGIINGSTRIVPMDLWLKFKLNPKYTTGEEYDQQVRLLHWAENNGMCFKYFPQYYTSANRQHGKQSSKGLTTEQLAMRAEIAAKANKLLVYEKLKQDKKKAAQNEQKRDKFLVSGSLKMSPEDAKYVMANNSKQISIEVSDGSEKPNIELSVIMPYFRAGYIGWLPLEALCRQQQINFQWEIIIMEETFDNPFGIDRILEFVPRLEKIGCVRLKYIELEKWLPLSAKWHFLIQNTASTSKVVIFNAADGYMSKHRLNRQYTILTDSKYDWHKFKGNIVYDIKSMQHVKFVPENKNRNDILGKAMTSELARKLPLECVKKSVDGWVHRKLTESVKHVRYFHDDSDIWAEMVSVHGLNNLSRHRGSRIKKIDPPLSICCKNMAAHMPRDIITRLKSCANLIAKHEHVLKDSAVKLTRNA